MARYKVYEFKDERLGEGTAMVAWDFTLIERIKLAVCLLLFGRFGGPIVEHFGPWPEGLFDKMERAASEDQG